MGLKNMLKSLLGMNTIKFMKSKFQTAKDKKQIADRRTFYMQFLKEGSLFFDIGANYGNRIEPLVNEPIKIIAIEPQIECVRFLQKRFGKKITVLQNGVGKTMDSKLMYIATNANILSSFSKDWIDSTKNSGRFSAIKWDKTRTIEMVTLDYLIATYGKPDFVKIDVEGFELEVLQGLTQTFKTLSIEYTVPERSEELLACLLYLNNLTQQQAQYNYCITENTNFALPNWVSYDQMLHEVKANRFVHSLFGDVYVKFTPRVE